MENKTKHHFLNSDKPPFQEVCDLYLETNYEDVCDDQLHDMKGIFMAGAASYLRLTNTIENSGMPEKIIDQLISDIEETANDQAGGRMVGSRVERINVSLKSDEVH